MLRECYMSVTWVLHECYMYVVHECYMCVKNVFISDNNTGLKMTIESYFKKSKGITLQCPQLPCVQVCTILGGRGGGSCNNSL